MKSTVDEIRQRFDADVERFSNLETGQSATVDAPLAMALVAEAAALTTPHARHVLDVGCGAGNYTLKLLEQLPNLDVTLIDLSQPMLDQARERVSQATAGQLTTIQGDIREVELPDDSFDIVLAAAVLHHLRTDEEWQSVFASVPPGLASRRLAVGVRPGRELDSGGAAAHAAALRRVPDAAQGRSVPGPCASPTSTKEDTPRPLMFQLDLLRQVGFSQVEVLHKNVCFAAFGAVKT